MSLGPVPSYDAGSERMLAGLDGLDVAQTLAAAGESTAARHAAEVRELEVDLHFAALHSDDPQAQRGPRPALREAGRRGMTLAQWEVAGNKLVQLSGDGAPPVQDLPLCELAIARGITEASARSRVADVLDLAHRLPGYWAGLRRGQGEVWVGRRIARMSRHLGRERVRIVDVAVTEAIDESPGRVLSIAEAAVLRADPEHARQVEEERRRRRCLVIGRSDEDGLRAVFARIAAGDAAWLDAMVERIADALESRPDLATCETRDELRAEAFGWLAHPEAVIALLDGSYGLDEESPEATPESTRVPGPRVVLHAHLSQAAVEARLRGSADGIVVRVEELGPMLLETFLALTCRADLTLKPVIDLNTGRSVNQYEHPADVKERGHLRTTGDVFPHAQSQSRRLDNDHPGPYEPNGPPGQTGDHNHAPLGRRHHRAKTHQAYQVHQLGLGRYLWRTPHGLWRLVDGSGTHVVHAEAGITRHGRPEPAS
ncbi:DUF222 domain-containing protein [Nocardioides dilutus]